MRKKGCSTRLLTIIGALILIGFIASAFNGNKKTNNKSSKATATPVPQQTVAKSEKITETPLSETIQSKPTAVVTDNITNEPVSTSTKDSSTSESDRTSESASTPIPDSVSKVDISQFEDASIMNGRGFADIPGIEPQYQNTIGYAAVYSNNNLESNAGIAETPWFIDVYEKNNQKWEKTGKLDHKSRIVILNQELTKKNAKEFQGYLEFQNVLTGVTGYIDVRNYVTVPYWDFDNINLAIEKGYCIASFKQTSKFPPVLKDGKKVSVDDDTLILLPAKGTYFISVSDKINYSVLGIVFDKDDESKKEYVFFNINDLTMIY